MRQFTPGWLDLSKETLSENHGMDGQNVLMLASTYNCKSVVEYILSMDNDNRPDINAFDYGGNDALMLAYRNKHSYIFGYHPHGILRILP